MAIEALGFCEEGRRRTICRPGLGEIDGKLPINPSGGVLSSNPVGATSLVRLAEAALQVMWQAGARQVPRRTAGTRQMSGGSIQFGTVVVLGNQRPTT